MTTKQIITATAKALSWETGEHASQLDRLKQMMLCELYQRYCKAYRHSPESAADILTRGITREDSRRIQTIYAAMHDQPCDIKIMLIDGYTIALLQAAHLVTEAQPVTGAAVEHKVEWNAVTAHKPTMSPLVNDYHFQRYMLNWFMSVGENASLARAVNMSRPIFGGQADYTVEDVKLVLVAANAAGLIQGRRFPADWCASAPEHLDQVRLSPSLTAQQATDNAAKLTQFMTPAHA